MKIIYTLLMLCIYSSVFAQTVKLDINAACMKYNKATGKLLVGVRENDTYYQNSLILLNPITGVVEKHLQLSGEPKMIELTPDNQHLYLSYKIISKIEMIDLEGFIIIRTIDVGGSVVSDFALLPTNEKVLIVTAGDNGNPKNVMMFKDGILQPKQVMFDYTYSHPSEICIKKDGKKLYAHNGISSGFEGHIMNIEDDGIVYDGIVWGAMLPSFNDIKIHNDLIYNGRGDVIDPFSDTIPIAVAKMPVYEISDALSHGFSYSEIHRCYIYAHTTGPNTYISFFHGQYFNYLGSLNAGSMSQYTFDIEIVDANHFILIVNNSADNKRSILLYTIPENKSYEKIRNAKLNSVSSRWFEQ